MPRIQSTSFLGSKNAETISDKLKKHFLERAEALGFAVDDLIFVDQELNQKAVSSDVESSVEKD